MAVADDTDLERVSLAGVAARLGVATTALYRYVGSKDELVELVVDRAVGPPPLVRGAHWQSRARQWADALLHRYREHPWLAGVQPSGPPRFPYRIAWIEVLLEALLDGPVGEPMHVALLLDSVARTFARIPRESADMPAWMPDAISDRYPLFARELARDWTDVDDGFAAAVATVLRGVAEPGVIGR